MTIAKHFEVNRANITTEILNQTIKNIHMADSHNIFISHKGEDDKQVHQLKARLKAQGYDVRNFSVDSTNHKDGRRPSDEVIARLLRMRVSWSSTLICLIGKDTHKSKYVNDEIKYAHDQGKRIVGIYTH